MTDDTGTDTQTLEPAGDHAVEPAVETERVPFWHRPHVERYLLPLVIPVVCVFAVVVYVLNLSRVFLSAHGGHITVVVGSVIMGFILIGATVLSNSSRLRSSTMALVTAVFIFVVFVSGWLVLGHSQVKSEASANLTATGPAPAGKLQIIAAPGGQLKFSPSTLNAKTGIYSITLVDGAVGQHTLDFDDPTTLWAGVEVNNQGDKATSRIYFGQAGSYTFFCAIPGHRTAGMQGTITVTGDPVTLEQAQTAK